jgi:hypothetical protein
MDSNSHIEFEDIYNDESWDKMKKLIDLKVIFS